MMEQELTLSEIHEQTLVLADKIAAICAENGLRCSVIYGTLLGAVRHGGFIPWDDDFDLGMLREDFDRFCAWCAAHEAELTAEGYRLMDKHNTPDYPFNIPRFCDLRYRMESEGYPDAGMGLFIDIYPFDSVGDDPAPVERRLGWRKKLYSICAASAASDAPLETQGGALKKLGKKMIYRYAKRKDRRYFLDKLDSLVARCPKGGSYVACLVWDLNLKAVPRVWFEELVEVPFENTTVNITRYSDELLRLCYGDYRKLPPEEKRHPTHSYRLYRK